MIKKILTIVSQLIVGLTFIFSGIVKCIDPIGTSIKFHDYFVAMNLTWLDDWRLFLAWCLCLGEFIIGLNIFFGRNRHVFTYLSLIFMLVMTPLTLWLALTNPVSDCGCFGEALILTNWQTFWKNVVLLTCAIIITIWQKHLYQSTQHDFFTICFYWELVIAFVLCMLGTNREPLIDFRPFRPGVNITEAMGVSNGESVYLCVYEKDGELCEFPLENLPDEDSGWNFVETKEVVSDMTMANAEPLIKDFFIVDEENNDLTAEILDNQNYTFLLVSPNLATADEKYLDRIENLYEYSLEQGYNFLCITLNDPEAVKNWRYRTGAEYSFVYSDATILETIMRSNPGLLLLKEGTILWKSCLDDLDVEQIVSANLSEQTCGETVPDERKNKVFWLVFWMLAPIVVYLPIEKAFFYYKKKKSVRKSQ